MRENIVSAIVVLSLLVYIPLSCVVGWLDFYTERKYRDLFNHVNQQLKLRLKISSQVVPNMFAISMCSLNITIIRQLY